MIAQEMALFSLFTSLLVVMAVPYLYQRRAVTVKASR